MADSIWLCKKEFGSACKGLPADNELDGKRYCVLHFPHVDKDLAAFEGAIEKKLKDKDFDFRGIYFPGKQSLASFLPNATFEGPVDFSYATFGGEASFSYATFEENLSGATFEEEANFSYAAFQGQADFSYATFGGEASFSRTTFEGADFSEATFGERADFFNAAFEEGAKFYRTIFKKGAYFLNATFGEGASFSHVTFGGEAEFFNTTFGGEASFSEATFGEGADFSRTIFKERGSFLYLRTSSQTFLSFRSAVIEKPERLSFHSTHVRPSWFIDVDAQKFDFSDVEWFELPNGDELKLEGEIAALVFEGQRSAPALRRLQKACRQLTKNAEENRDYPTANEFHYWSMVLARKEAMVLVREQGLREGLRRFGLIEALYGALSGYGERPRRAFLVLVGMWAVFAILYLVTGSVEHVGQAFLYSLAAMVRLTGVPAMAPLTELLQPSEPGLFQLLVTAEGILGPLQIALLALAIRRQVMR